MMALGMVGGGPGALIGDVHRLAACLDGDVKIAVREENGLAIRVYGDENGLEWRQEDPHTLTIRSQDRPLEI